MFKFLNSKKELDITDALKRKEARITIGGKSVVVRAFKLVQALEFLKALGDVKELLFLAGTDFAEFNKRLLAKMPVILSFCLPGIQISPEEVTVAEFADLLLAVWCVNDMERIYANFMKAVQSMPKLTLDLATSQKS